MGGSGLDRIDDFQKFCRSGLDRIQIFRFRIGLGLKNFSVRTSLTTSISSFLFQMTKSTVSRIRFSARYKTELERRNLTTVNMVEWKVTRQSSVRVTPLLYLFFLLMYLRLHKFAS